MLNKITPIQTLGAFIVSIVVGTVGILNYLERYATRDDVYLSELNVSIRLMKLRAIDFEYIIASGRSLTPIEQNTYTNLSDDIKDLQKEKTDLLNEK